MLSNKTFEVEYAYYTLKITPVLTAERKYFSLDEKPEFTFEYINEEEFKATLDGHGKALGTPVTGKETIKTFVYDYKGELTDIEPEIEELSGGREFSIKLPGGRALRAGIYKLRVELVKDGITYTQEQEFQWGLVSLNTRKSIYKPGEPAEFIIVVLDKYGYPVCNADISMTVTNPNNEKTTYSTADGTITASNECGLYTASYLTEVEGKHTIDITAQTLEKFDQNASQQTLEKFDVISDADIQEAGDTKTITWNKDLIGNKTSVCYSYAVPAIRPYLYALGPAGIDYDSQIFTEARSWYVAVDPTETSKSPTDDTGTWDNSTNAYLSNDVYASTEYERTHEYYNYSFTFPAGSTITKVEVGAEYYYASDKFHIEFQESWDGGTNRSTLRTLPDKFSDNDEVVWTDVTGDTSWTTAKLSDSNFRVRIKAVQDYPTDFVYMDWLPVKVTNIHQSGLSSYCDNIRLYR